jgi:hypothetical protein
LVSGIKNWLLKIYNLSKRRYRFICLNIAEALRLVGGCGGAKGVPKDMASPSFINNLGGLTLDRTCGGVDRVPKALKNSEQYQAKTEDTIDATACLCCLGAA